MTTKNLLFLLNEKPHVKEKSVKGFNNILLIFQEDGWYHVHAGGNIPSMSVISQSVSRLLIEYLSVGQNEIVKHRVTGASSHKEHS